jgi:Cu(I)/Ag(I) efflux system membrane protein CusA/SilA
MRALHDFEEIVLAASEDGSPIRIKDIGQVVLGPELRRGLADLDGAGEAVTGIVIMRQGENTPDVIRRVKAKLQQVAGAFPEGFEVRPIYDRSELIDRAIANLKRTLVEVAITVSLVILLFLWHVPSALIPIITMPLAVLIAFLPFRMLGISANIMSLGGIAIAISALVDASIVVVEQVHKKLEERGPGSREETHTAILSAIKEVGRPSFYALLVLAVSFFRCSRWRLRKDGFSNPSLIPKLSP